MNTQKPPVLLEMIYPEKEEDFCISWLYDNRKIEGKAAILPLQKGFTSYFFIMFSYHGGTFLNTYLMTAKRRNKIRYSTAKSRFNYSKLVRDFDIKKGIDSYHPSIGARIRSDIKLFRKTPEKEKWWPNFTAKPPEYTYIEPEIILTNNIDVVSSTYPNAIIPGKKTQLDLIKELSDSELILIAPLIGKE